MDIYCRHDKLLPREKCIIMYWFIGYIYIYIYNPHEKLSNMSVIIKILLILNSMIPGHSFIRISDSPCFMLPSCVIHVK